MRGRRQREADLNLTDQPYFLSFLSDSFFSDSFLAPFFLSFLPLALWRLVKRALPSPVPMVSTPQLSTSCMNGISARPCTTASLCISTAVSWLPILGMASTRLAGRLNLLLSQLPGRFCAPFSIDPSSLMTPGQAMPMNGASLNPSSSAALSRSLSIFTNRLTASSRVGSSSAYRHSSDFQ